MSHTSNEQQAKSSRRKRPTPGDRTETLPERRRSGSGSHPGVTLPAEPTPSGGLTEAPVDTETLPTDDPNRYELAGEHARGGLGRILKARDRRLGRTVAVKELIARTGENEMRFVREALITARLQHPGIVPVHEAGRWPSGEPYYVMKLISGQSLKELVTERATLGERLSLLPNVIAVAEAIGYAHSQGVIHRDLKPSNVVVGEFGETVVVDWGLAKDLRAPEGQELWGASLASSPEIEAGATADVIGTPAYMPPEQAEGGQVDERTDVYAIGAVLYHLLSGEAPYAGDDSGDIVSRVLTGPPVPVDVRQPGIAPDLVAIIGKAMARIPGERYRTSKELAEDLKRFQTGKLVTAHDYSTWTLLRRWIHLYRAPVGVAAIGLAILAAIGVLAVNRIIDERNVARIEREQAQSAQRSTEERTQELLFLQAQTSFDRDPTAALAWLKQYPHDGPQYRDIPGMIDRARASGVARHVFRHADWAYDVVFSPDGNHVASASKDGLVMRWDLITGDGELLLDNGAPVRAIAFSPDGSRLAIGDYLGTIKMMTLADRKVTELVGHKAGIGWLAFTPDSEILVSTGEGDGISRIWRVRDGALEREFGGSKGEPQARFSDDARFYGILDNDDRVSIRSTATGEVIRTAGIPWSGPDRRGQAGSLAHDGQTALWVGTDNSVFVLRPGVKEWDRLGDVDGPVTQVEFSPSNKLAATASATGAITLWDLATGHARVLRGHTDSIYEVSFSADEEQLVSASDDGTARLWDLRSGASHTLRGHEDDVLKARFSPDGTWIATASLDRTVRIWPTRFDESRALIGHESGFVGHLRYTRGDDASTPRLISQAIGSDVLAWDLATGTPTRVGAPWPGPAFPSWQEVWPAVISSGGHVAAAHEAGGIELFAPDGSMQVLGATGERYHAIAFSPDDRLLVASNSDHAVLAWDVATGDKRVLLPAETSIYALAFAPAGDVLAVIGADGVRLWNMAEGQVTKRLATPSDARWTRGLFSRDGSKLALISRQGRFAIWEPASVQRADYSTDKHHILDAAFSPDGQLIAAAVADRTVRVWDLANGGEPRVLTGHTDLVLAVEFSPDGKLLASGSYDRTLRLWKRGSWESRVLHGHTASVDSLDFSPDGKQLASISRDGAVKLWHPTFDPDPAPRAVQDQLAAITTAVIGGDDQPQTPR